MYYKTEMHCHTSEVSRCANENAKDTADKYVEAGYTTVVLTNHINSGTKYFKDDQNEDGVKYFLEGYDRFVEAADGRLNVLLGVEINFERIPCNDFLVYGMTREFLLENPDVRKMKLRDFHEMTAENGMLIVQAHPFRPGMTIINANYVDGIEVFNGHPGHASHNDIADKWANYYNLIKTAGTDHHNTDHPATCGILTTEPITTNEALTAILKTNDYRLLCYEKPTATKPHPIN